MSEKETFEELSTEEKILVAAQKVFTEKGFSGTRTRDIAEEADINLALLNYYFRSKEKLFEQVMKLKVSELFGHLIPIVTNEKTTLEEKIDLAVEQYFKVLTKNPNLPIFILSEIQKKNSEIKNAIPMHQIMENSTFFAQIQEKQPHLNPLHFLLNFLGLTIFPFIAKHVFMHFELVNEDEFQIFIKERKTLIPIWMKTLLNTKIEL